ncbi:hypothetical protein RJP21_22930 [Paenibacillus sp. VCA1]|uniref:hypothetical protein n=1 Tax=Paenibacillus sp. VCA1 TaxID=3039148 RepID=UPI002871AFF1|nr:hypothetical protein [Paenibacillus sp. VCA1]MDR9856462.1 hypothetical protein [Paenibacillus sp. VCA1]
MKYKIYKDVSKNKIKNYIPPGYLSSLPASWPDQLTMIVFKTGRNDVVLSNTVADALMDKKMMGQENLIAFGGCFTIESIQLFRDKEIEYVALKEFPWTDERYKQIRMNSGG